MIFRVSQISPSVELVFANTQDIINVYPPYHQQGNFLISNVDRSAWTVVGGQYRWETSYSNITAETVPVIQLLYSYNITEGERKQQYEAFTSITAVETVAGKLYLYANSRPYSSFRIRYRILNKLDLAIPMNRLFGIGISYQSEYENVVSQMTALNPVTGESVVLNTQVPSVELGQTGMMPGHILARLLRLERERDAAMQGDFFVHQLASPGNPESTTWYPDLASFLSIPAGTYSGNCEIGCKSLAIPTPDSLSGFFRDQTADSVDVSSLYTSNVTDLSYAFENNSNLATISGLDLLDTHVTRNMSYMFAEDANLLRLDLRSWYTDAVINIEGMFKNCSSLEYLNVSSFDFTRQLDDGTMLIDQPDIFKDVPADCELWVGGQEQAAIILSRYPDFEDIYSN